MKEVFSKLLEQQNRGEDCILVSAVGGEGSAPRKTHAHMLVNRSGRVCGTVGGGAVEGRCILLAQQLLAKSKASFVQEFELHDQAADDIGMVCGGRVKIHFSYAAAEDTMITELARRAAQLYARGTDTWLMINLLSGALSLYSDGELIGADLPDRVLKNLFASAGQLKADDAVYYTERMISAGRVYIFGGGHVAQALVPVLAAVDFRCVVLEDREEFCNPALFEQAEAVRLVHAHEWESTLQIGKDDCICIMTRGHQNDLACQAFAMRTKASYIGVIGSRRKIASVNQRLKEMGFTDDELSRIITPIGLEIGAVTPAEIAVSIAAQMIKHRADMRKEEIKRSCMA